ncbi:unnamed protein product [Pelagomonas calceolata]|uniref:Uncharacterized protein n=1 Tax=Pelagomonas calceolata TaxID=35677 RepID=A0A8J2WIE8_9STRA|nr:unnamed protein product [Pelagomonas calceolata]
MWPCSHATNRGVRPSCLAWSTSAPPSRSCVIASTSPILAAACNG